MSISIVGRSAMVTSLLVAIVLNTALPSAAVAAPAWRPVQQSASDPLVLAFYYPWFDENSWSYDQLSDLPAEPYVSRDRAVMGRHIDQAKAAGIDAFLVAWYGPGGGNQTEPNLTALLEEAAARNFRIGMLFETDSPFLGGVDSISGALQHALTVHASQPAFLRVDGRPVIFFWRPTIYGVESWRAIRNSVDPGSSSLWIAEGVDTSYLAVFDGHHLYSNTWNPPADLTYTNQKFARLVEEGRQRFGAYKFWVATVMPGYNDTRIRPNSGFATDRAGGAYYDQSWQAAIGSAPNWVVITSFNEWPEGTYIEPSVAYGAQYLGATAAWSAQFKAGGGQAAAAMQPIVAAAAPAPQPSPTPLPEPTTPTVYVQTPLLNLRAGPSADAYAIVGQVTENQALAIVGRDASGSWWQIEQAGAVAWLAAAYVYAAGPLDGVPIADAPVVAAANVAQEPQPAAESVQLTAAAVSTTTTAAPEVIGETSSTQPAQAAPYQPILQPTPTPASDHPTYQPKLSRYP